MKNKQSNELARFAWAEYLKAHDEYFNSSMFGGGGWLGSMKQCESLITCINETFDAHYESGTQILSLQERYLNDLNDVLRQEHRFSFKHFSFEQFTRLFDHYTEPQRYYHTLTHIAHG